MIRLVYTPSEGEPFNQVIELWRHTAAISPLTTAAVEAVATLLFSMPSNVLEDRSGDLLPATDYYYYLRAYKVGGLYSPFKMSGPFKFNPLPVAQGGTGANTIEGLGSSLGFGALATENSIDVGSDKASGVLPVNRGGTNAGTVTQARANLGIGALGTFTTISLDNSAFLGVLPLAKGGFGVDATNKLTARLAITAAKRPPATVKLADPATATASDIAQAFNDLVDFLRD
jgi:hypothetical protein